MNDEMTARQLEALGNPTRLALVRILAVAGEDGVSVGHLQRRLAIAASTLSHHLRRLVASGLVTQERRATTLICRAAYPVLLALVMRLAEDCGIPFEPPSSHHPES